MATAAALQRSAEPLCRPSTATAGLLCALQLVAAGGRCNIRCKNYVLGAGQLRYDDPMTFATALLQSEVPGGTDSSAPSPCTSSLMLQKLKGLTHCFRALARRRAEQQLHLC